MAKVEFDIVRPNLYLTENNVWFGIDPSDFFHASRFVDGIVRKHIGELMVMSSDLEVVESGKAKKTSTEYSLPLYEYLDALQEREDLTGITNPPAKLFDLSYLVNSRNTRNPDDLSNWELTQKHLSNPQEYFDLVEKEHPVHRLDRERTLSEIKRLNDEITSRAPQNYAEFYVIGGQIPRTKTILSSKFLGFVGLDTFLAKDRTQVDETKSQLIEKLKEIDGPCLSFDAPSIFYQATNLYDKAPELVRTYGDILASPWRQRLFRLDP